MQRELFWINILDLVGIILNKERSMLSAKTLFKKMNDDSIIV